MSSLKLIVYKIILLLALKFKGSPVLCFFINALLNIIF